MTGTTYMTVLSPAQKDLPPEVLTNIMFVKEQNGMREEMSCTVVIGENNQVTGSEKSCRSSYEDRQIAVSDIGGTKYFIEKTGILEGQSIRHNLQEVVIWALKDPETKQVVGSWEVAKSGMYNLPLGFSIYHEKIKLHGDVMITLMTILGPNKQVLFQAQKSPSGSSITFIIGGYKTEGKKPELINA